MPQPGTDTKTALPAGERRRQVAGILGLILGPVLVAVMWVVANLWRDALGRPMPYENMLVPLGAALILTSFGLSEWLGRQVRADVRASLALAQEQAEATAVMIAELGEMKTTVAELPRYAQGVIDGVLMRGDATKTPADD